MVVSMARERVRWAPEMMASIWWREFSEDWRWVYSVWREVEALEIAAVVERVRELWTRIRVLVHRQRIWW